MGVAKLRIEVDGGADIQRMLGQVGAAAKRANATMAADTRAANTEAKRAAEQTAREQIRAQREVVNAQKAASRERANAERTAAREAARTASAEAKASKQAAHEAEMAARQAERDKTREARRESNQRIAIAAKEAAALKREQAKQLTYTQLVERERTAIARQEAQERARAEVLAARTAQGLRNPGQPGAGMRYTSRFGQVAFNAFGAAREAASSVHSGIQGARERDAGISRNLGLALYQAGAGRTDIAAARAQFGQFAAAHGMDASDLASAALAGQSTFSIFGDRNTNQATRGARINDFLANAQLARNTGNDVTQFTNLSGMLSNAGLDTATVRSLMLYSAGASQRGAVELGALTSQAMPAITGRIAQAQNALGANATTEQRNAAAHDAFVQSYAELQVARGMEGVSPTQAGNSMRAMTGSLSSQVTQQKMLTNIRNTPGFTPAQRHQLEATLFESNGAGGMRLRGNMTNALNLVGAAGGVLGNSATAFNNLFAGGGHGDPQSLQTNWRRIAGGLLGSTTDEQGRTLTGVERVRQLMGHDTALSEADVARGEDAFGHDQQAELNRNQEENTNSLRDNTSAITSLSDRIADMQARNPIANALLGGAASATSASLISRAGTFVVAGSGAAGAAASGGSVAAKGLLGSIAAVAAPLAIGGLMSEEIRSGAGEDLLGIGGDAGIRHRAAVRRQFAATHGGSTALGSDGIGGLNTADQQISTAEAVLPALQAMSGGNQNVLAATIARLPQELRLAIQSLQINATVAPQDAAHAAAAARSQPSGTGHT